MLQRFMMCGERLSIIQGAVAIVVFSTFTMLCDAGPGSRRLIKKFFVDGDYDVNSIPVQSEGDKVEIIMYFDLNHIVDLDLVHEVFRANVWINMYWLDYQLRWNPEDYNGSKLFYLPQTKVWTPNLHLINSVSYANDKMLHSVVGIHYNGAVHWFLNGQFSSTCDINVKWFPYDEQICEITFVSLNDMDEILLRQINGSSDGYKGSWRLGLEFDGEWNVLAESTSCKRQTLMNGRTYETAVFAVHMMRRPLYYVFNLIIPCALISFLALLTFKMPPDGGDKLSLSITVLLALTVFQLVVADKIPPTPKAIPLIGVYFMMLMILCTLSVVATTFVLGCYHRAPIVEDMPAWVRIVFCKWLAWLFRVDRSDRKLALKISLEKVPDHRQIEDTKDVENTLSTISNEMKLEELAREWKFAATVLDRLFFWIFVLCFGVGTIVVFCRLPAHE